MRLKNPSFGIPPDRRFSPMWRRIQRAFSRDFLARDGATKELEEQLYVSKRVRQGLEERDVLDHVDSDARRLMLVIGPAGIGKTTFLRHTLDRCSERSDIALVWVDVLRDVVDV